jgi:hypothetical protein
MTNCVVYFTELMLYYYFTTGFGCYFDLHKILLRSAGPVRGGAHGRMSPGLWAALRR